MIKVLHSATLIPFGGLVIEVVYLENFWLKFGMFLLDNVPYFYTEPDLEI